MADNQAAENDAFRSAKTLTVPEVAYVLQSHVNQRREAQPDYQPNMLLAKTMEYATHFSGRDINRDALLALRSKCTDAGFTEQELALAINLKLSKAEEAKLLVPSFERYADEDLEAVLFEVLSLVNA